MNELERAAKVRVSNGWWDRGAQGGEQQEGEGGWVCHHERLQLFQSARRQSLPKREGWRGVACRLEGQEEW